MIARAHQHDLPLATFFTDVYQPAKETGRGPRWGQWYTAALSSFRKFLEREPTLGDLDADTITAWMRHSHKRGNSPVTINQRTKAMKSIRCFAVRKRYLPAGDLDDVELLPVPRRLPKAWSIAELDAIIRSARLARGRFFGVEAGKWWASLVLLMFDTGLRVQAAMAVRFDEIDFKEKLLRVPAERMKNDTEQYYRLHDQTVEAILDTLPPEREKLFPWPFEHYSALYGRFRRILIRAGLPSGKRDMFHKLRRTTATQIAARFGDALARQQLGHRTADCIRNYVDPRFTARHDLALSLPRPAWDNPRAVQVEVQHAPEPEPTENRVVQIDFDALTGKRDFFAALAAKPRLSGDDVGRAIDMLGVKYRQIASAVGCSAEWLGKAVNGRVELSFRLEHALRVYFGLERKYGRGESTFSRQERMERRRERGAP
jgi:integrase